MIQSETIEKGINNIKATPTRFNKTKWFSKLSAKLRTDHFGKFQIFMTLAFIFTTLFAMNYWLTNDNQKALQTKNFVAQPEINDLYFLDFRVMSDKLRPRQKYRLAKVIDITGDTISLVYGDVYYYNQHRIEEGIRFGQLMYNDYFQRKRHDFTVDKIKELHKSGAIYMAKRPVNDELFDNFVTPSPSYYQTGDSTSTVFIAGKHDNDRGMAVLKSPYSTELETKYETAFKLFERSAQRGYPQGQVNLAEIYLNDQFAQIDLNQALYWLKRASLQSHKPAIVKYAIVCKQVANCDIYNFYQQLLSSGVNIKVRNLDFKLTNMSLSK